MQIKCHREMFSLYGEAGSQKTVIFAEKNGNLGAQTEIKVSARRKNAKITY
jgi:hypothetical protein